MLKEKCSPPLITLPEYTWVDEEVSTYFSNYNHPTDLTNLLSWLSISTITSLQMCLVILRTIRFDATSPAKFVFMNREGMNIDFFYMHDYLFRDLHVRVSFDDFTMGVLWILNVALAQLHPNEWAAI